eukprot:CAMPEP_0115011882 /NCGR_PEP_ID=MMETSP0216-20121206/24350_1 /TAXON_ID=223996 /ORGANISM="Protocruzia adherens, Strain Boccale" /LENGTH=484 /DNA_ID=CAMNT_0002380721 /DNA_START=131 /DNA_END=1585 /DNA_ORIENTATION=+
MDSKAILNIKPGDDLDLVKWHQLLRKYRLKRGTLSHYSIFKPECTDNEGIAATLLDYDSSEFKDDVKFGRALACMMGMVIGDSWGHLFEFDRVNFKPAQKECIKSLTPREFQQYFTSNAFNLRPGQWTDDSSMGLCIADSLIVNQNFDGPDIRRRFLMWWELGYDNAFRMDDTRSSSVGLGGNISQSMHECLMSNNPTPATEMGNEHTSGNGGIMRLAPVPIFYHHNLQKAIDFAKWSSRTTHQGMEAADCAKILSFVCVNAMNYSKIYDEMSEDFAKEFLDNLDFESLLPHLESPCGKALALSQKEPSGWEPDTFNKVEDDKNWDWKSERTSFSPTRARQQPGYFGSFSMDGLLVSLYCFYRTNSFEECMLKVINFRGDSDSTGSVCGQMAGALYGIQSVPKDAIHSVLKWDNNGEIGLRAKRLFFGLNQHESDISQGRHMNLEVSMTLNKKTEVESSGPELEESKTVELDSTAPGRDASETH